jgi:excisionase family DNA binding protein
VDESGAARVTIEEAARLLGIEKGSVKKRIQRGKLRSEKDASGTQYVYVDRSETVQDQSAGRSQTERDELVTELHRTNELLRAVITTRDEEIRRRDTIIMNMTEAMKALNPPAPEDSSEVRESPESSGPAGELGELREELDTERTRREMAESTLHEGMDEERRRREEAEWERDDLRRELFALRGRESPEPGEEQQGRGEPRPATGGAQEGVLRRLRRRVLGS